MVGDSLIPGWVKFAAVAAAAAALLFGAYHHGYKVATTERDLEDSKKAIANQAATLRQQENIIEATNARDRANEATSRRLLAMLDGLRDRPERPAVPSSGGADGQAGPGTGANLYREDGEFLAGEAARADKLRAELARCYAAIDAGKASRAARPTEGN